MKDFLSDKVNLLIVLVFLGLLILFMIIKSNENAKWEEYKTANHCQKSGYISNSISNGATAIIGRSNSAGIIQIYNPEKTRWKCDNGVEIFR